MKACPRTAWRIDYATITPVKIVKETKMFLYVEFDGYDKKPITRRTARRNMSVYDTWTEAHQHLVAFNEARVKSLTKSLETAQATLLKSHAMKEPS